MISDEIPPPRPASVVRDGERAVSHIGRQADTACARVQRVGHDLCEDGLFECAGIGIAQVFEEMLEINARFAQEMLRNCAGGQSEGTKYRPLGPTGQASAPSILLATHRHFSCKRGCRFLRFYITHRKSIKYLDSYRGGAPHCSRQGG